MLAESHCSPRFGETRWPSAHLGPVMRTRGSRGGSCPQNLWKTLWTNHRRVAFVLIYKGIETDWRKNHLDMESYEIQRVRKRINAERSSPPRDLDGHETIIANVHKWNRDPSQIKCLVCDIHQLPKRISGV